MPEATYTGFALRASDARGPVPIVDRCDASGQMLAFSETKSECVTADDPRLWLEERYHGLCRTCDRRPARTGRPQLDLDVQNYIAHTNAASVP